MTTALCFHCGSTKFGALCPCQKCGVAASGDPDLDILFSDHRMTVATLEGFGQVIERLARHGSAPEIRFWAFISYVSSHPAQLLSATPPEELAEQVKTLLAEAQLPVVEADLLPVVESTGPPRKQIPIPNALFQKYVAMHKFIAIERVQVRRRDGLVVDGTLLDIDGSPECSFSGDIELTPEEIAAIRPAPGCLLGWLIKPRWVETE